jgi:hypothetical protein
MSCPDSVAFGSPFQLKPSLSVLGNRVGRNHQRITPALNLVGMGR